MQKTGNQQGTQHARFSHLQPLQYFGMNVNKHQRHGLERWGDRVDWVWRLVETGSGDWVETGSDYWIMSGLGPKDWGPETRSREILSSLFFFFFAVTFVPR